MTNNRHKRLRYPWEWIGSYLQMVASDLGNVWMFFTNQRKRKVVLGHISRFFKVLYHRITTEGVLKESASLTYITLLGFVPFLMFIVMLAPDLPFLNLKEKVSSIVTSNFLPNSAAAVQSVFDDLLNRRAGFNIFSFALLIVTSYSLFRIIRGTFDRILSMQYQESQDWLSQIVKFLGTIIFGVFIMVLLFSSSSLPLISRLLKLPILQWLLYLLPFLMQFLALMFLYMLMPSIKIRRGSLIRGTFWTTLVWVLAKSGFDIYIFHFTNIQAVYGVLAALPIFLMWIYINWVIILGGIVLVSVLENKDSQLQRQKQPQQMVRLTLEMYSDAKLNQRLEKYLSKDELKELTQTLDEEG